jgi:hypothetical protein
MKYVILFSLFSVVCQISVAELSFDEIRKNPKAAPPKPLSFKTPTEVAADLDGTCIFQYTTSPYGPTPTGALLFVVGSPDELLRKCKEIPDDSCPGGVVLGGHAGGKVGTSGLLYSDPFTRSEKNRFYPPEKETRSSMIACFKRISKNLARGEAPLTFASCITSYPTAPESWDKRIAEFSKELGVVIRASKGTNYSDEIEYYGIAEYGWTWSHPADEKVYHEDGINWIFKSPGRRATDR